MKITLLKLMIFYLPSTLDNEDKIAAWKAWNRQIKITMKTPLSAIYDHLKACSGLNLFDEKDQSTHIYLRCYIDCKEDLPNITKSLHTEYRTELCASMNLSTNLTDILNYSIIT